MRRIDDRVIDGIVKAFLDDLGKYYVQEPELFDYLLVRDANYEQSHKDFLTNVEKSSLYRLQPSR